MGEGSKAAFLRAGSMCSAGHTDSLARQEPGGTAPYVTLGQSSACRSDLLGTGSLQREPPSVNK